MDATRHETVRAVLVRSACCALMGVFIGTGIGLTVAWAADAPIIGSAVSGVVGFVSTVTLCSATKPKFHSEG